MIEIRGRRILVDGKPVVVMAGEVHYFRLARDQWPQRIELALEAGCTAIASYIPWLWHELPDGSIDVTGRSRPERDIGGFIDLCAASGLQFIARPGPFVMAELKNEGIPYRVYSEHPEIVATGWDGAPAPTATVDYLAPAFLAECERWFASVLPVLAARLQPVGGNVIAVQLDNEIGMLAWISNSPDLTDTLLADLLGWCRRRYGDRFADRYPEVGNLPGAEAWRRTVRSPQETWAGALRVDLHLFMRDRFAEYTARLAEIAASQGISGVPLLINIHGTEGGNGVPFGIGISQLLRTYAGVKGMLAGSDHYLGEMTQDSTTDMHFINACMAAVNDADQPLASLEFEAGTGDYADGLESLNDPSTVELKTRLCLAQGNRLINYYLLAGGVNPALEEKVGDGNDRISFTGERHGTAAPIGPEGRRGLSFSAVARTCHLVRANADWLGDMDEEHDDLAMAFLPDAFATEYHYPASAEMTAATVDLAAHRGPGQRKALWRSLLFAGYRFGAVNLQDPTAELPSLVGLASGVYLDSIVQQRLVEHLHAGGRLLQLGPLPEKDLQGRPCRLLIDALGVRPGALVRGDHRYYPSVTAPRIVPAVPETRVGWLQQIDSEPAAAVSPLLLDVDGRVCGVHAEVGPGRAVLLAAELPSNPTLFTALVRLLGLTPGLAMRTDVLGVVATTSRAAAGGRMLHLLNPTGYPATVFLTLDGKPLTPEGWALPPRTGRLLPLGVRSQWGRILSSTSEVLARSGPVLTFGPSLDPRGHRVVLDTEGEVTARRQPRSIAQLRRDGRRVTVTAPDPSEPLSIEIG